MLATFHHNAGVCVFHMDKFEAAITKFQIANDIRREIDDKGAATSANRLGDCFLRLSEYKDALERFKEAIEKRQQLVNDSKSDSMLAAFYRDAGVCLFHMEKFKEAITKFEIAKHIRNEIDDPVAAISANWLGDSFFRLSEYIDALEKYHEAIEKRQQSENDSKSDSMLASFSNNAGVCLFHTEKFKEAITKFEIAKDIRNEIDDHGATISANRLGDCFLRLSEYKDVLEKYQEASKKDSNLVMTENLTQRWLHFVTILEFVYFIWRHLKKQ